MKKIININFQGRVIPIEESAYDILQQYIDSLRRYFNNEEGRDEIINDIEGRIGELFNERMKRGAACITDDDVNAVIASMGRPEDFDAQEGAEPTTAGQQQQQYQQTYAQTTPLNRGGLFRNSDDKVLGGVCSGLANYFKIDPIIMRIIFVFFLFGGFGFLLYIILWIVVPAKSLKSNIVKRLFRNPDDKVIGGVCGGLAQYFKIDSWIPRLIFILPLVLGVVGNWNFDFDFGPRFISGSLGSTLFLTYIILWIALPYATTAADKLEMKGERVDLNSIRDTVNDDLGNLKSRAQSFGNEVKDAAAGFAEKAKDFGSTASQRASMLAAETAPVARRAGSGIGNAFGILFKIFFLFIAGVVALSLFGALIGIMFGGMAAYPFKDFLLGGIQQNFLLWATLILFLAVPVIGLITWLIRRIMNVRSNNRYLGWIFGGLWTLGWICAVMFVASLTRNFKSRSGVEESVTITQPDNGKFFVDVKKNYVRYYDSEWFGGNLNGDIPVFGLNNDSLMLNTVRVNVVKSNDSSFHVYKVKYSRNNTISGARSLAEKIEFPIEQSGNTLTLPSGFAISKNEKFRNQQVLVVIEVPVGKRIEVDKSVEKYDWFNVNTRRRNGVNIEFDEHWDNTYSWDNNVEYIMTPDGLKRTSDLDEIELKNGRFKLKIDENGLELNGERLPDSDDSNDSIRYRYDEKRKGTDTTVIKVITDNSDTDTENETVNTTDPANVKQVVNKIRNGYQVVSPLFTIQEWF